MEQSKRYAVEFLEKEIKTYMALARFLSKEGIKERVQVGQQLDGGQESGWIRTRPQNSRNGLDILLHG